MISLPDLIRIIAMALLAAVVVGALGLPVLRFTRRSPVVAQILVVVVTSILAVVAGMLAVAAAMYVSPHDLIVTITVAAVSIVIAVAVAWMLGRALARNIAALRVAAQAVGDGRLEIDAGAPHNAEFTAVTAELAATSRRLAESRDQVAALDASRRELVAWISHDLRTPLAALRAMTEALEDGVAEDTHRYHRQMRSQVDRLSVMVDDLFELSKIQSGRMSLVMEAVPLYDLVSDAVAELGPLADAKSICMEHERAGDLTVVGDPRELARVVGNLLINAIQHSKPGDRIVVSAGHDGDDGVLLTVADSAGGIPEHDLHRVFEPGWRGDASRTPEPHGTGAGAGLGLAIVRGIVRAHEGDVTVQNIPGGCRFDVRLRRFPGVLV